MNLVNELTRQEAIVLALVARGWRNARIARELFISPRTVESHLYRIFDKLRVSSRTEAMLYAFQAGFVVNEELSGIADDPKHDNSYANT